MKAARVFAGNAPPPCTGTRYKASVKLTMYNVSKIVYSGRLAIRERP